MENSLNTIQVEASGANMTFGFKLADIYLNFGGQVEISMTRNAGEENEVVTALSQSSVQINLSGVLDTQEKLDQFLTDNPAAAALITQILTKASQPYAG